MDAELERAYRFCRNLARTKAGNFYYAFIFLPKPKRRAIYALYAFCQYTDNLVDEVPRKVNPVSDIDKLRADLANCLEGKYSSPLFIALGDSIRRYSLPIEHFHELIDGIESDLHLTRIETFDDLERYCYLVASTVGLLCVEIFGYRDKAVRRYAENLGVALQLTNIIRDIKEDALRGRVYLPVEDLERFNYSLDDLANELVNENFHRLMELQYNRALEFYRRAEEALPPEELKSQVASEIMKKIYRELLETVKRSGFRIFDERISVKSSRKILLALTTYLNIRLGLKSG